MMLRWYRKFLLIPPAMGALGLCSLARAAELTGPLPTDRDRVLSEADTYFNCFWYLAPENILNDPAVGTVCPYDAPGWQRGVAYKAGGYDDLDTFLQRIAEGAGAGDKKTPSEDPRCTGNNCSGFVSWATEAGRQYTWTFGTSVVSTPIAPRQLRMGDLVIWYAKHARIFVRWVSPSDMVVYECTTSITPASTGQRVRWFPFDDTYRPFRLNTMRDDPEPIIQMVTSVNPPRAVMPFDGEAGVGYRIQHSTNGVTWNTVLGESHTGPSTYEVSGNLSYNTNNFLRVVAVNPSGELTAPSDAAAIRISNSGAPKVLLVDGLDSWRHRDGAEQPGHTFLIPIAQSLGRLGYAYETAANEMVVTNQISMEDYFAVIWLAGEDAVWDESISRGEQFHFERYLEQGGKLLLSASNVAWDLSHQPARNASGELTLPTAAGTLLDVSATDEARFWDPTDCSFLSDYLHVDYLGDVITGEVASPPVHEPGTEFHVSGAPGTPLEGLTLELDDGTHGTYNARFADVFTPVASAEVWLTYDATAREVSGETVADAAAVAYTGTFGAAASTEIGSIVTLGFPLETVYRDSQRDALLRNVLDAFAATN